MPTKLTPQQVSNIRDDHKRNPFLKLRELSHKYDVTPQNIFYILNNRTWVARDEREHYQGSGQVS